MAMISIGFYTHITFHSIFMFYLRVGGITGVRTSTQNLRLNPPYGMVWVDFDNPQVMNLAILDSVAPD